MTACVAIAAPVVGALRQRIAAFWPRSLDDATVLVVGFCGFLGRCDDVLELACSRQLALAIARQPDGSVALNGEEALLILAAVAQKTASSNVCRDPSFVERAARIAAALQCTLSEPAAAALWKRQSVQLACLVGFQSSEPPFRLLDAVFGSIVRADIRRVEDLHFESVGVYAPSVVLAADALFAVAHAALA